jgi:hypothetical protein
MTLDEASWLMRDGSKVLADFHQAGLNDQRYGAVWTTYKPFTVHLRVTRDAPDLVASLAKQIGDRKLDVTVRGASYGSLLARQDEVAAALADVNPISLTIDHEFGTVVLETNSRNTRAVTAKRINGDVVVRFTQLEALQSASFAGADRGTNCTTGYAARRNSDNFRGIVTAGHCSANGTS